MGRFTVRGRWENPRELTWQVVPQDGPIAPEILDRFVAEALDVWERTGVVAFRRVAEGQQPTFTISWHGADGSSASCRPFGRDNSVAHSGPLSDGTFIHLDESCDWSLGEGSGESLSRTLQHEVGHILGLDHCADESALMAPLTTASGPTESDLAGLHSLYGGLHGGPGDLLPVAVQQTGTEGPLPFPLRRVAPPGLTEWALFDTDGDGSHEVLVWRTDAKSLGALMIYHFNEEAQLERTVGPLLNVVPPEADTTFMLGVHGDRWIVTEFADGLLRLRSFDERGWPQRPTPQQHLGFEKERAQAIAAPSSGSRGPVAGEGDSLRGDLDGDGSEEFLMRFEEGS
ncbi:MAG: matrixin family metalloprotease [Planctomycetota bacterium]|nr:matrixin family metalloprotease [Planctomycetota bacterium]